MSENIFLVSEKSEFDVFRKHFPDNSFSRLYFPGTFFPEYIFPTIFFSGNIHVKVFQSFEVVKFVLQMSKNILFHC